MAEPMPSLSAVKDDLGHPINLNRQYLIRIRCDFVYREAVKKLKFCWNPKQEKWQRTVSGEYVALTVYRLKTISNLIQICSIVEV